MESNPNVTPESDKGRSKWMIGCGIAAIVIFCIVIFVVLGGLAGFRRFFASEPEGLSVEVVSPASPIMAGDEFTLSVKLSNLGTKNITVTEIQLPGQLSQFATVNEVTPPDVLSKKADSPNQYLLNLLIAPNGQQTLNFSFVATQAGELSDNLTVFAGKKSTTAGLTISVIPGMADADIQEEEITETKVVETIPYRSVVQIIAVLDIEGERKNGWWGSGTIISEDGLILTNAHVVLSDRYYRVVDLIVSITQEQDQPPVPTFYAEIIQADANVDLAVIKIRSDLDGNLIDFKTLGITPVPLGDSQSIQLGDPLTILGYQGIGGETITLTLGEVSGFTAQEAYGNRAFIKTSATSAGGNSGGLAANAKGEIIGVPTQLGSGDEDVEFADCRPLADTNRDGVIDENDSCIPLGGFINALRPVHLAIPLIEAAKAGQVAIVEYAPPEEQEEYDPEGDVILFDEFNDNRNNWGLGEYDGANVEITSGKLLMYVYTNNLFVNSILDTSYESVILGVDAEVINTTYNGDFGFVCGYQNDGNFTALEISEDGYYTIWAYHRSEFSILEEWTYSEVIAEGGPYVMSVYCGPEALGLAVNGILLVESLDPNYTAGYVGLMAGTYDKPNLRVAFDNFVIMRP